MILALFLGFITVGLSLLIEVAILAHFNGEHHHHD